MSTASDEKKISEAFGSADDTNGNGETPRKTLSDFEGLAVTESGIEIPDAAGGLRDALEVDPIELHKGQTVYIALACDVSKVRFDPIDRDELDGAQRRVHVFKTRQATIVDYTLVKDALAKQAERIAHAKEIEGQQRLDTDPDGGEGDDGKDEQ